jgi:circadian clock protein KaiB
MAKKILKKNAHIPVDLPAGEETYVFQLFIAGMMINSIYAIENIRAICEEHLKERYELEVIDIYQQPELARTEKIIAVPVLVKIFPLPSERVIGDLSDTQEVLKGLHIL